MAWIRTIPWSEAGGTLKDAYDWQAKRLGEPTEYTQLGSLYPELVMQRLQLYKCVEACPSGLTPMERQMAALVTSVLNETPHCSSGLLLKLESLGADRRFLDHVATDPRTTRSGDPRLDAIMEYAVKLTLTPGEVSQEDVDALRMHGLEDLAGEPCPQLRDRVGGKRTAHLMTPYGVSVVTSTSPTWTYGSSQLMYADDSFTLPSTMRYTMHSYVAYGRSALRR